MKKVLILNALFKPNIGGVENSIAEITDLLVSLNHQVDIVCSNRNNESDAELKSFEKHDGFNIYRYNYVYTKLSFVRNLLNSINLLRSLKEDKAYDYVISRNYLLVIALRLAGFTKIKFIPPEITYYSVEKTMLEKSSMKTKFSYYFKFLLQSIAIFSSDEVFVFSDSMIDQVKRVSLGLIKVKKVEPGVNLEKFTKPKSNEKAKLRTQYSIPINKKVLLALGRYSELKQFDLAILAMQYLEDDFLLLLVGSGPELENYRKLISDHSLESKIKIMESTKEPQDFYKLSDAFLMTSRYESFGQTIIEAGSTNLKIIAFSKKSGVNTNTKNMLSHYKQLFLVDEQSALKLSKGVIRAFYDHEDYNKTASSNKNLISERYSWSQFLKNIGISI